MKKYIILLMILISLYVQSPIIRLKQKILPQWHIKLRRICQKYNMEFHIMKAILRGESHGKKYCTEYAKTRGCALRLKQNEWKYLVNKKGWRKGYPISFGRFQVSLATCRHYQEKNNIKTPKNRVKWAYENSIEVGVWSLFYYKKFFGNDIKAAMSAHNIGPNRYGARREKNKYYYYWPYIRYIQKHSKWKIK